MKLYYVFYAIAFILAYTAHSIMKGPWSPKVKWSSFACIVLSIVIFLIGLCQAIMSLGHIKINVGAL